MRTPVTLHETLDGYFEVVPRPTPDELAAYYRAQYYGGTPQYTRTYTPEELAHKTLAADEAARFAPPLGALLEVGFGEGFFLAGFRARGWRVRGLDFTDEGLRAFHPELAPDVALGDVFALLDGEIASGRHYELVACNNVLEHVLDPERLLRAMHALVAPGGVCRLQVPNDGSWLHCELVARGHADPAFWVHVPDHLNYFTPPSLQKLLARCGWAIVDVLGDFPIELFLLNPDSNYERDRSKGRNCHFARVAVERLLRDRSIDELIAFRRGCAHAGLGRNLIAYVRPGAPA